MNIPKDYLPGPKLQCPHCQTVIQSKNRYDWDRCQCGKFWVYGGKYHGEFGGPVDEVLGADGKKLFRVCADPFCRVYLPVSSEKGLCSEHYAEWLADQPKRRH